MKRALKGRHKILCRFILVSPLQGSLALDARPRAHARGYFLSALRAWIGVSRQKLISRRIGDAFQSASQQLESLYRLC